MIKAVYLDNGKVKRTFEKEAVLGDINSSLTLMKEEINDYLTTLILEKDEQESIFDEED
jgi:hypothetical protein